MQPPGRDRHRRSMSVESQLLASCRELACPCYRNGRVAGRWTARAGMGCLDEETIAALGAGRLDADVTRTVTQHAAGCAQCWRRLVQAEIEPSEADETIEDEDQASLLPTTPGSSAARVSELGIVAKDKV